MPREIKVTIPDTAEIIQRVKTLIVRSISWCLVVLKNSSKKALSDIWHEKIKSLSIIAISILVFYLYGVFASVTVLLFFAFLVFVWDIRFLVCLALSFLFSCPLLFHLGKRPVADKAAFYAYTLVLMALILQLIRNGKPVKSFKHTDLSVEQLVRVDHAEYGVVSFESEQDNDGEARGYSWLHRALRTSLRSMIEQPLVWILILSLLAILFVTRNSAMHQTDTNKEKEMPAIIATSTPLIIATTTPASKPAPSSTPQDSDRDGLSDEAEIEKYKSDPQNPDTDGDGFNDGQEVRNGYNPAGPGRLEQ